jgi:hypothetical protein
LRGQLPENPDGRRYKERDLAGVKFLVVHHSAVDVDSTAAEVANYHIEHEGFPGIGYHFCVHWDGTIDYTQDITVMSYNVASLNDKVIGVLLPGNFMDHWPTSAALESARALFKWLKSVLPATEINGHYEIALPGYGTACPGATFQQWKTKLVEVK